MQLGLLLLSSEGEGGMRPEGEESEELASSGSGDELASCLLVEREGGGERGSSRGESVVVVAARRAVAGEMSAPDDTKSGDKVVEFARAEFASESIVAPAGEESVAGAVFMFAADVSMVVASLVSGTVFMVSESIWLSGEFVSAAADDCALASTGSGSTGLEELLFSSIVCWYLLR